MTVKVLLADDHGIFREALKGLLEREKDISIIADTDDGAKAVELALALRPDVAIIDISMPLLNGINAARRIAAEAPEIKVIIWSMHIDKEYVLEALRVGAKGILAKTCTSDELVQAIQQVAAGHSYLSPTISNAIMGLIPIPNIPVPDAAPQVVDAKLSNRENQVLRLLVEDNCTKEIGSILHLSAKTVETYRSNLMKKLKITSIVNLVKYAIREGITTV